MFYLTHLRDFFSASNPAEWPQAAQPAASGRAEAFIPLLWLLLLAGSLIFFIVHNATWIYGDDWLLLMTLDQGQPIKMNEFFRLGRFYPLAFQDYNAFIPLKGAPAAIYCWVAVKFVLLMIFLGLFFSRALSRLGSLWAGGLFLVLYASVLFTVFTDAIYPENSLLPLLAIFGYGYLKATLDQRRRYYLLAALAALLACYFKEPVFGLFLVIALVNLIFRRGRLAPGEKLFSWFLLLNSLVYLGLYYALIISPRAEVTSYLEFWDKAPRSLIAWTMLKGSAWLLVVGPLVRLGHWLIHLRRPAVSFEITLADALGAAGLAYGLAFVILGINEPHYFIVSSLLAFMACSLYAGDYGPRLAACWRRKRAAWAQAKAGGNRFRRRVVVAFILTAWCLGSLAWFAQVGRGSTNVLDRGLSLVAAPFWPEFIRQGYDLYFWVPPASLRGMEQYEGKFAPWPSYYSHTSQAYCGRDCPPLTINKISDFSEFAQAPRGALVHFRSTHPQPSDPAYLRFMVYPGAVMIKRTQAAEISRLILKYLVSPKALEAVVNARADLDLLREALAAYHERYGRYPISRGMASLYSPNGTHNPNWIPGLAPAFIDQLPRDRRLSREPHEQYIYLSNGRDYKLLAVNPSNDLNAVFRYPELIDPARDWCLGYWTPNAITW